MKYTKSKDGVERISIKTSLRVSKQDLEDLKPLAKSHGYTSVTKFIRENVLLAFDEWIENQGKPTTQTRTTTDLQKPARSKGEMST